MLTASVAAAIRSDSFSKSVTHITPRKGVNRHSPVVEFIIARRFVMGKHKTEQIFVCSVFMFSFCLRHYTTVLSALEVVNYNAVAGMQQQLAQNTVHPLDRTDGCDGICVEAVVDDCGAA